MVLDLDALVEQVAGRVAELLAERLATPAATSPWLTADEAAEYLRCGRRRIYDLVREEKLEAHGDGARLLFRHEELDEYVLNHQPIGANH